MCLVCCRCCMSRWKFLLSRLLRIFIGWGSILVNLICCLWVGFRCLWVFWLVWVYLCCLVNLVLIFGWWLILIMLLFLSVILVWWRLFGICGCLICSLLLVFVGGLIFRLLSGVVMCVMFGGWEVDLLVIIFVFFMLLFMRWCGLLLWVILLFVLGRVLLLSVCLKVFVLVIFLNVKLLLVIFRWWFWIIVIWMFCCCMMSRFLNCLLFLIFGGRFYFFLICVVDGGVFFFYENF